MTLEFLKPVFEDQLGITVDDKDDTRITIGDTPFTASQILKNDNNAYFEEFSNWFTDRWLPEQKELLEQQLGVHTNRRRFDDLCNAITNDNVVPLIGSGMSVPTGLPMWSSFMKSIRIHSKLTEAELDQLLSNSRFEEAADRLAASMPARLFDERIEHDLRVEEASSIAGAIQLLPEIFGRVVLTTNLDNLLEKLFAHRDRQFSEVLCGGRIAMYRRVRGTAERILLKLHGDCGTREGRILGTAEYDAAYLPGSAVYSELSSIYQNNNLLCLGCSLDADRTVELLGDVSKTDPNMPKHFAFLKHPGDKDVLMEREHYLTERDVFPIWYVGDHDAAITSLLAGVANRLGRL